MPERHPAEGVQTIAGLAAELSDIGAIMLHMAERLIRLKAMAGTFCCRCTPDRGHDQFCQHEACAETGAHLVPEARAWAERVGLDPTEAVRGRRHLPSPGSVDALPEVVPLRGRRLDLPVPRCTSCGCPYDEKLQAASCPHTPLARAVKIPEAGASTPQRLS